MDDTQDQQVGGACAASNPENAPSEHHESDESNPASNPESNAESNAESTAESAAESTTESSDSDQGIVVSGAEGGSDGNEITGKIIQSREDFDADPNVNLTIGSYKIIARNEACTLYQCVNNLTPGMVHTCSLVHPEDKFKFMAAHERVRGNPLVNQIHEVVTEQGKSLVIYQSNYGDLHHYCLINKSLPEPEVAKFFKQILTIMIDVHRVGIIPRELKLKKFVFVDEERTKLVLDTWEDSILLTDPEDDAIIDKCGCPPYVSPEVLTCKEISSCGWGFPWRNDKRLELSTEKTTEKSFKDDEPNSSPQIDLDYTNLPLPKDLNVLSDNDEDESSKESSAQPTKTTLENVSAMPNEEFDEYSEEESSKFANSEKEIKSIPITSTNSTDKIVNYVSSVSTQITDSSTPTTEMSFKGDEPNSSPGAFIQIDDSDGPQPKIKNVIKSTLIIKITVEWSSDDKTSFRGKVQFNKQK